jgi:hypothetical protein
MPDHLASDQANRPAERGQQGRGEVVGKQANISDLGSDQHDLGQRPVTQHDGEGRQEMIDPESMEAELPAGRVEVVQAKTTDSADPASGFQRVDDHHLAAILEVPDRSEARDPRLEHLHRAGQAGERAESPEDMDAEAIVALPGIPEAYDVEHHRESHDQAWKVIFLPDFTK